MNDDATTNPSDMVDIPLPPTSALARELAASRHIGAARFGVAVRIDETMQVTDVLIPLTASRLAGPEIGYELTVALERARRKATAALRARFLTDPDLAEAIAPPPVGPGEETETPEPVSVSYASDDGVATVHRVAGGPITSVVLDVGEYFAVTELPESVRQAATRALTDAAAEGLDHRVAGFDATMERLNRSLDDLGRRLDTALTR